MYLRSYGIPAIIKEEKLQEGGRALRIVVEISEDATEPVVTIKCREKTALVDRLIAAVQIIDRQIMVLCEGNLTPVDLEKILYIESVDKKCFVYTQEKVYESSYKLYELEGRLEAYMFVRISKSGIVNLKNIRSIKAWLNRKLLVTMENGEQLVVSRQYAGRIKELLGVLGGKDA